MHTSGFGFGSTGAGPGRTEVFGGVADFQGAEPGFESHLGHVFSLFRGFLASESAQIVL